MFKGGKTMGVFVFSKKLHGMFQIRLRFPGVF